MTTDSPNLTSLYNLPISLEIFTTFVSQKIIGTGRDSYPLMLFVWDLIKFIMDKAMSSFGKGAQGAGGDPLVSPTNFKLDMTSIDLPTLDGSMEKSSELTITTNDMGYHMMHPTNESYRKGKSINAASLQRTPINQVSNAFLFHAQTNPFQQRVQSERIVDRAADRKDGVFHFYVGGPDRGLIKKIKFIENKNTLFSTAMMRNGQNGGLDSGRGVIKPTRLNCELTLVGNPYFFIGQLFYVNTELISSGHFREENIMNGGYYIVTSVESRFSSDGWETHIRGVLTIPDTNLKFSQIHKPVMPLRTMSDASRQKLINGYKESSKNGAQAAANQNGDPIPPIYRSQAAFFGGEGSEDLPITAPTGQEVVAHEDVHAKQTDTSGFNFVPEKKPAHPPGTKVNLSSAELSKHMTKGGTPGAVLLHDEKTGQAYLQY